MKKRQLRLLLPLLFLSYGFCVAAQKREVHILSVNDMHATIGVFPQLAALIDSLRTVDPSLLVFSAGDNRTGNTCLSHGRLDESGGFQWVGIGQP